MNASHSEFKNPDRSLAGRDDALPGLPYLLDDARLSSLLGETVRVTRVRYKPRTSLLVAFRRIRNGSFDYGWAHTLSSPAKLLRRESTSQSRGGNVRILRPDPRQDDMLVAVGGTADDWALHKNLLWLYEHGIERLGLHHGPDTGVPAGSSVLRYKPERRLVLLASSTAAPVVLKAAAKPASPGQQAHFLDRLRLHGVPLLPQLGDTECLANGISACVAWGRGDLTEFDDDSRAFTAGEALARLHGIPITGRMVAEAADSSLQDGAGSWLAQVTAQLKATRSMVSSLVPAYEEPARCIEAELGFLLLEGVGSGRVLVHGDFSPDQVLVGGSEVRLIDFDRARPGMAEADLGSFAAVEETVLPGWERAHAGGPKTARLIEGYVGAGGRFSQTAVDAWAAFRLFNNSVEPFRNRSPEWAAGMSWHLNRAMELIS